MMPTSLEIIVDEWFISNLSIHFRFDSHPHLPRHGDGGWEDGVKWCGCLYKIAESPITRRGRFVQSTHTHHQRVFPWICVTAYVFHAPQLLAPTDAVCVSYRVVPETRASAEGEGCKNNYYRSPKIAPRATRTKRLLFGILSFSDRT